VGDIPYRELDFKEVFALQARQYIARRRKIRRRTAITIEASLTGVSEHPAIFT
jgi:hypothetical protein